MSGALRLAFDTSGPWCAAVVARGGNVLAQAVEEMTRGQAERLMPLVQDLLDRAGCRPGDLAQIGVGIGPGNFTGTRISVAAARGLALGLGIPAVPLSAFELIRESDATEAGLSELVVLPAPRGQAYAQPFCDGRPTGAPELIAPEAPPSHLRPGIRLVTGHAAATIAAAWDIAAREATLEDLPVRMAALLERKVRGGLDTDMRPAPLYVRPADAAPPADPPPVILP